MTERISGALTGSLVVTRGLGAYQMIFKLHAFRRDENFSPIKIISRVLRSSITVLIGKLPEKRILPAGLFRVTVGTKSQAQGHDARTGPRIFLMGNGQLSRWKRAAGYGAPGL
jgi:hypothetical protein